MKRERYKRLIMFCASALVIGLQTAVFAYVWFTQYDQRSIIRVRFAHYGYWGLFTLYALIVFVTSKLFGALRVGYMRVQDVLIAQICSVLCANAIEYLELMLIARWRLFQHLKPILWMTLVDLVIVIVWVIFMRWIYSVIFPPREAILIYDKHNPEKLLRNIASRRDKYLIREAVLIDRGLPYIEEKIPQFQTVILGDLPSHERNVLVKFCFEKNIRCYVSPKISDIMIMSSEKIHMFDTPLLLQRNQGLTADQQFFKRMADIIFSVLGVVILSPVFLIIAIAIKLYDHGPVFYRQERLTQDGKIFMILKFRSMTVHSEDKGAQLAQQGDSRVTPVGRVIRKIHFDELPQLFNIIKGDMSIVGPRPERPEIAAEYEKKIPEFSYRLKVKAGLTGYAQVYGKYNTPPYEKLKLDLTYIENYSFLLDLQLIATTVKILFQKENTEGVQKGQKTAQTADSSGGDKAVLEQHVQNTVKELRWQQESSRTSFDEALKNPGEAAGIDDELADHLAKNSGVDEDLLSVVIPVHNGTPTICETLDSVLAQKIDRRMEVLLIDDGSTDDLEETIAPYLKDPRLRLLHNSSRLGVAKTRNRGVLEARGKYIAFVDADDIWKEGKLQRQLDLIKSTGAVLCCTGRELIQSDGTDTGHAIHVKERLTYRDLLWQNPIACSSVVILTEAMRKYPMSHEDSHEDYITWMKVLKDYGFAAGIDEPLILYRLGAGGKSGGKLKSAAMTYRAYRYMGFSVVKSCMLFVSYAFHGVMKYGRTKRG